jgi:Cysteine-rich secretory protein family
MLHISQKIKKIIQKRVLKRASFGLLLALFILGGTSGFVQAADVTSGSLLRLTNESRKQAGLPLLKQNDQLKQAAEAKAKDMFKNDYFAHTSPKGVTPWHWIKQSGYQYGFAGENLAINYETSASQHKAWMKSKTHRANILSDKYQEIGIAVVAGKINGKEALVTVQVFASPKTAPVVAKKEESLPIKETLVADVKGVERDAQEAVLPQNKVIVAPVDVNSTLTEGKSQVLVQPETAQVQNRFNLYILLTLIVLQIVIFSAAMPFLYTAILEIKALYKKIEIKTEPLFAAQKQLVGIHAFDIHVPKAF